jgi:hypothetical protein
MTRTAHNPLVSALEGRTYNELRMLKYFCEQCYRNFALVFFRERTGLKFLESWHHRVIFDTVQRVLEGQITRLIINCPPGFSKTELLVVLLFAYTYVINPSAKNLHLSYSEDLALDNSRKVKDIVSSDLFQAFWPGMARASSDAKHRWITTNNGQMAARPMGGQVTGNRAGRLERGFTGLLVVDDPIKPEDIVSSRIRNKINKRFPETVQSRLMRPDTPMILIMQRLGDEDPTAFLARGGTGEMWHHLIIPAEVEA